MDWNKNEDVDGDENDDHDDDDAAVDDDDDDEDDAIIASGNVRPRLLRDLLWPVIVRFLVENAGLFPEICNHLGMGHAPLCGHRAKRKMQSCWHRCPSLGSEYGHSFVGT